jgi:hypothetical protein
VLGQRRVKRRVEHRRLGDLRAEREPRRLDALEVVRIVEGGEVDRLLDAAQPGVVEQHRVREALTAVDDAVADRVDLVQSRDGDPRIRVDQPLHDRLEGRAVIANRHRPAGARARTRLEVEHGFAPDPLDDPARESLIRVRSHPLGIRADELKLERRRTCVENEDVHAQNIP